MRGNKGKLTTAIGPMHVSRGHVPKPRRLTDEDLRKRNYPPWFTEKNVGKYVPEAGGAIQSPRLLKGQRFRIVPKTRMTTNRGKEIIRLARERAEHGPWSDQIDKVLRPGEREQVNAVWSNMSGSTSFVDALHRISMTPFEVVRQAVALANRSVRSVHVLRDPLGYLFVRTLGRRRSSDDEEMGKLLIEVLPTTDLDVAYSNLQAALQKGSYLRKSQ